MPDYSSNNRRIAKNSFFLSIRMVIVLGITLYTTRALLKLLGVEDYGVYNVVCGFVSMFAFLNTSMSNGIQRFFNFELGKNGKSGANIVYNTALIIQFLLAMIVLLLTETIGLWYLGNKMVIPIDRMIAAKWIFQCSILSFIFIIMQAPYMAAVMAHEKMDIYAMVSILDALLKLGIVLMIPLLDGDYLITYGFLWAMISVLNFFIYFFYCKKNFDEIRIKRKVQKEMFRSMIGFSGWNMFGSFSILMKDQGTNLVMNYFFGPVVNAAQGVATQVNGGVQAFVSNITIPVRPQIVQSYAQGNISRAMNLMFSISKISAILVFMLALPICLEIDYILKLWLNDNIPNHASSFIILILTYSIISNLNSAISNIVHATGKMREYQIWGSLVKLSSVPIAYMVMCFCPIPELAILIGMFSGLVAHIVSLFIVRNLIGMPIVDYIRKVFCPIMYAIIPSFFICIIAKYYLFDGFCGCISLVLLSIVVVSIFTYYLTFSKSERELVVSLAMKFVAIFRNKYNKDGI